MTSHLETERRSLGFEVRAAAGRRLVGYAAVFDAPTRIGEFTESVKPGAFADSLRSGADILALVDHDPSKLLARASSGSLSLKEDGRGLAFEITLPDTSLARDVLALAEARNLGGMSFGFRVPKGGDAWPARDRRELRNVDLLEISVVQSWPAYQQTSVSARSRSANEHAAAVRARQLALLR
jgi:uncharacterized protein